MRPVIGITDHHRLDDYRQAIARAGGEPRVLDVANAPAAAAGIHGLLLPGGADIDPGRYGAARHPAVRDAEPRRDAFELALARAALDAGMPLFAICRGLQVLNVALGGDLIQHVPDLTGALAHDLQPPRAHAHLVQLCEGTRLRALLGPMLDAAGRCAVNSRHHQAVGRLGIGLTIAAAASDGIVEAVELAGARFCLGVQWHPENFWRTGEFQALFEAFVAASRG